MSLFNLPEGIDENDYWIIRAQGIEWSYVLTKVIEKCAKNVDPKEWPVVIVSTATDPYYLLKRKFVPVEELVFRTGLKPEELEGSKVIELTVRTPKDLPEPSVSGWGEA